MWEYTSNSEWAWLPLIFLLITIIASFNINILLFIRPYIKYKNFFDFIYLPSATGRKKEEEGRGGAKEEGGASKKDGRVWDDEEPS